MEFGMFREGFVAKPYPVILEEERAAFKAAFGNEVDISEGSTADEYITGRARKITACWETMEAFWSLASETADDFGKLLEQPVFDKLVKMNWTEI